MTFEEFLDEWRNGSDSIIARSSGSTGKPKEMNLSKGFLRQSGLRTNSYFSINSGSRLHSCVAADFIGGKMMAVRSELAGCRLTWETPSNTPLGDLTPDEVIDLLAVVPSQMIHIIEHLPEMPVIRNVIIGGSAIHPDLRLRIIKSGLNAYETYGMTETASHIALRRITESEEWFYSLPGIGVKVDERGCLVIEFDSGEHFVTNDLVEFGEDGGFAISGRYDNVIITGGKKVSPEDVERRIRKIVNRVCGGKGFGEYTVSSKPDEKWGERVVLRIEKGERTLSEHERNEIEEHLMRGMREALAPHEVPKEIEWVANLERTENRKIRRR